MVIAMSSFSERKGLKRMRTQIQVESIDGILRNRLWNLTDIYYWSTEQLQRGIVTMPSARMASFLAILWNDFFKEPMIHDWWSETFETLRKKYLQLGWFGIYDFIEFMANDFPVEETNEKFMQACNSVLEAELSAYRFVGGEITEVTSKEEISAIEEAINSPIAVVNTHLQNALSLFSDRQSPDYRNSIKESISAVEAICKQIANNQDTTLGQALNTIEREGRISLHPKLKEAFSNLYHYTSDADGIRHSLKDEKINVASEEAKFMLVACSAFVNYLVSKMAKAPGITQ